MKKKKISLKITIFAFASLVLCSPFLINISILKSTENQITNDIQLIENAQVGLLLGARVYNDNKVSQIVYDRIIKAVELYNAGKILKIIISGDHGQKDYDEVNTIKSWLIKYSVDENDIFMDHAGFSTYESIYRAKEIFNSNSIIIITQEFHLPRAVYIANQFNMNVQGFIADRVIYIDDTHNQVREFMARVKDCILAGLIKPEPTYLGDKISLKGSGLVTQD